MPTPIVASDMKKNPAITASKLRINKISNKIHSKAKTQNRGADTPFGCVARRPDTAVPIPAARRPDTAARISVPRLRLKSADSYPFLTGAGVLSQVLESQPPSVHPPAEPVSPGLARTLSHSRQWSDSLRRFNIPPGSSEPGRGAVGNGCPCYFVTIGALPLLCAPLVAGPSVLFQPSGKTLRKQTATNRAGRLYQWGCTVKPEPGIAPGQRRRFDSGQLHYLN